MLHLTRATALRVAALPSALPLFSAQATRQLEQALTAVLPTQTLMQRAGLVVARLAQALAPHANCIWIACGPGNNGGDGLEAAVHLQRWRRPVRVSWLGSAHAAPLDAQRAWQRARDAGVPFIDHAPALSANDLAIDALLGIGARRAPAEPMVTALRALSDSPARLLCVDLPSGLDADTGQPLDQTTAPWWDMHPAYRRHTLSLLTLKPGLFTAAGRDASGQIWFDDLGTGPADAAGIDVTAWLNATPAPALRRHASHKGHHGDVAVVGGASGMSGAAVLAAQAALQAGAGRVFLQWLQSPAQPPMLSPDLMLRPWTGEAAATTVVCGCGGGTAVHDALPMLLAHTPRLVLDADALNAIAADTGLARLLQSRAHRTDLSSVLTPHPLEAARLLGYSTAAVQADRLAAAALLVERTGACVLLKGSGTVIAAPNQRPRINPSGNARLAIGGTGDVLAGLLAARLAQLAVATPDAVFEAACAAAWEHGMAAERATTRCTLTASALAQRLTAPGDPECT